MTVEAPRNRSRATLESNISESSIWNETSFFTLRSVGTPTPPFKEESGDHVEEPNCADDVGVTRICEEGCELSNSVELHYGSWWQERRAPLG